MILLLNPNHDYTPHVLPGDPRPPVEDIVLQGGHELFHTSVALGGTDSVRPRKPHNPRGRGENFLL